MTRAPLPVKGRGARVYGFLDGNRDFYRCFGGKGLCCGGNTCGACSGEVWRMQIGLRFWAPLEGSWRPSAD